ncbi:hypothetical protein EHS25_008489 [Saitozyma podzolica]|uniref:Ketoreductase domain-containing protein n=1 Tax=Saitozyma podzolica TaxID=1890683 RepID=A0A427YLZ0_9TREE|nr:hypothetical protein EHS25_008489 [Saitozyma podzolica]
MAAATTVLISGANRGIGLGLAQAYAALPNHTVVVALRNPSSMPTVKTGEGSKVVVVKLDAGVASDAKTAIDELKSKHGVTKLDIVIANAAIMHDFASLATIPLEDFEQMWRVNTLGSLALFQACVPLMPKGAKFIFMSSGASIIDRIPDKTDAGYGITKSAVNYLARYAHFENPDLVIFSMSPGWVQTEMGDRGARNAGLEHAPTTVDESVSGMIKVIEEATRDKWSGLHARYNGTQSKW